MGRTQSSSDRAARADNQASRRSRSCPSMSPTACRRLKSADECSSRGNRVRPECHNRSSRGVHPKDRAQLGAATEAPLCRVARAALSLRSSRSSSDAPSSRMRTGTGVAAHRSSARPGPNRSLLLTPPQLSLRRQNTAPQPRRPLRGLMPMQTTRRIRDESGANRSTGTFVAEIVCADRLRETHQKERDTWRNDANASVAARRQPVRVSLLP